MCYRTRPVFILRSKRFLGLICLCVLATEVYASQVTVIPAYSQAYDPGRDPFADGRAALKLAKETRRRVLIEVGGDWCGWCHVLDRFLNEHPFLQVTLNKTFVLLKVNVDETNDNAEFLSAFPRALGYPHMYITDSDGNILFSQDTAEFLDNGKYSEQRFRLFLDHWSIPNE
jgi:thiol:disulfide interchange protein